MDGPGELRCHELVELVTHYVDGALEEADRTRFELHVVTCRGCQNYVEQMRQAAALAAHEPEPEPDPEQLAELLDAFRGWHRRTLEDA